MGSPCLFFLVVFLVVSHAEQQLPLLQFPSVQRFQPRVQARRRPNLALQRYGQYLYDGLVLFLPSAQRLGGSLDVAAVLDFVDSGHDLILAADVGASDRIRDIATECGADFDEDLSAVVRNHTLIAGDDFIQSKVILGDKKIEAAVLFRGVGHSLNAANSHILKVLTASPSAYSANPNTKLSSPPTLT